MKRLANDLLDTWYKKENRKPLVIRGARQVGKSTLVRQFAAEKNIPLHEVNLEKHSHLDTLFAGLDINRIIREMEHITGLGPVEKTGGIIFLDEIQATPNALPALRYFYEEKPEVPVIAAGSLLEFVLSKHSFSMPVGRIEYCFLGPMTFMEFLEASGKGDLLGYLEQLTLDTPPSEHMHGRLLDSLREYLIVGGMPEAVDTYCRTNDTREVSAVHAGILQTYQDDFGKYAGKDEWIRLQRVFNHVPLAVGEKFTYAKVDPFWKSREVRSAVDLLTLASVIHRVHHTDASGTPLAAMTDDKVFKPLFLDIGLMNSMAGIRGISHADFISNRFVNEGRMAEQFIGQELLRIFEPGIRPALYFWLREGKRNNAEVDFVCQENGRIIPVEVKAGKSGRLRSLVQFMLSKGSGFAVRFDLNQPSVQTVRHSVGGEGKEVKFTLLSLPLYLVGRMPRFLEKSV